MSAMIAFAKAHAYGNDFLYVLQRDVAGVALDVLARQMCDRHTGIGADGLIAYDRTDSGARMRLVNADGSPAEISGNGVRALAAILLRDEPNVAAELTIQTDAGPRRLTRVTRDRVRQTFRAAMGAPSNVRQCRLSHAGGVVEAVRLSIGNPHCVVLGPLPDADRFRRAGAALEHHPEFPGGTNVEFAEVEATDRIRVRIWERGVGPTTSSGTGSCAALIAAAAFGGSGRDAEVIAPGGVQRVEWTSEGIFLTGWAEIVCVGDWLGDLPASDP
jgi:diaminopimelate epimerase